MLSRAAELSQARANRLARRAAVQGGDGRRGLLARRAWQVLATHGDRGDQNAASAVWEMWLREPSEEPWQALTRWWGQETLTAAVFMAGTRPERHVAIGEFCARHGLAPRDPVQRALFWLLTGQPDQHRAADPDGRLLAVAYQSADRATRAAVREALAATGDSDLIWAVADAGQRARTRPLTGDETEYLVRELAGRADWSRLWQLVMQLPLTGAVAAMRHFADRWHPESERERALFGLLARTDPAQLAGGRDALTAWGVTRVQFEDHPQTCWGGAVSADSRLLALVRGHWPDDSVTISVHELPWGPLGGRMRREPVADEPAAIDRMPRRTVLTFAGDALIAACVGRPANDLGAILLRYPGARFEPLAELQAALGDPVICGLAPCFDPRGGFTVVCENFVAFCHGDGTLARRMPVSLVPSRSTSGLSLADVDPAGRVAIAGYPPGAARGSKPAWQVYDGSCGQILARSDAGGGLRIRFLGPGRLAAVEGEVDTGQVRLWDFAGTPVRCRVTKAIAEAWNLAVIPGANRIGVAGTGTVRVLDAETLQQTGTLGWRGTSGDGVTWGFRRDRRFVTTQWNSAGNTAWVTAGHGFADVFRGRPIVSGVVDRAPAEWAPADLVTVTAALADSAFDPAAGPLLQLLRARLEDRFGTEVAVGTAVPSPGPDEIGLTPGGGRPC